MHTRERNPKTAIPVPVHLSKLVSSHSDYEYTLNPNGKRPLDK